MNLAERAMLSTLLSEPHRKYHNLNHIHQCLIEFDQYEKALNTNDHMRKHVEDAIWYHDIVYNPYATDNEERSAEVYMLQRISLIDGGTNVSGLYKAEKVRDTILATAKHTITQENLSDATKIMLDIDLAGFGKSRSIFAKNGIDIRNEYYNTSTMDFMIGRMKFYDKLSGRPTLYYTEYFYNRYHNSSQENIKWEMVLLDCSIKNNRPELWKQEIENALQW
jgi:predicted metal-dependent HD superfamily phosphohydrolase